MLRQSLLICSALAAMIIICGTTAANDIMTEKYEKLLEEQGYVVKQLIQTAPMYFKVEVEALDTVTLKCTAYYLDQIKKTEVFRITPDDEEIVFMIPDGVITEVKCDKIKDDSE